ncbi:MAG: LAGLIDADG family homing endonuclease, partial [Patescibacteria group bacterium]
MDWKYIAGFFDGEGSICHNGKGYRITISQTNKGVLNAIYLFIGKGQVIKVTKRKEHWKESWIYYIAKQEDVFYFLKKIENLIIVKSKQTNFTLKKLKLVLKTQRERRLKRIKMIKESKVLRKRGYTYRQI